MKQQGHLWGEHELIFRNHSQRLSFLTGEVGKLHQKVDALPLELHELQEQLLQEVQDKRFLVAQLGMLKLTVEKVDGSVPEIVKREVVSQVGDFLDQIRLEVGETNGKVDLIRSTVS